MSFELPSVRSLSGLLSQIPLLFQTQSQVASPQNAVSTPYGNAPSCPVDSPLSCHNTTIAPDSCCFIYPGGQLLQTQFWDTNPTVGPSNSWTLHGLWPDLCDGSYPTYCNAAPTFNNITSIVQASGNTDLLADMEKYWLPNAGTLEHFWEHEWNKHGTCINTLSPSCYGDNYTVGTEVVDFFTRTVEIFKGLDTYAALASAGITPSTTETYTLSQIQDALKAVTGYDATIGCRGGQLNQAWYSFNVKGSLQTGDFVPIEPVGTKLSCPSTGIKYLPKHGY